MSSSKFDFMGQQIAISEGTQSAYQAAKDHITVQDGAVIIAEQAQEAVLAATGITLDQLKAVHRATVHASNGLAMAAGEAAANAFKENAELSRVVGSMQWGGNTLKVGVERQIQLPGIGGTEPQVGYCQTLISEITPKSNEASRIRQTIREAGLAMFGANNG